MNGSLKRTAVNGIAWTSVEKLSTQIVQFVIGVAIARVLAPADYGVVGMTAIFFAIAGTFIDSGFGNALIQKKDRSEADYATCFYFNFLVGLLFFCILYALAPAIAAFYKTPILCDVTRTLSLTLVINSLTIAQNAKLTAEMKFKALSVISVTSQIISGCLGLYLAYTGRGVWALVVQMISGCVLNLIFIECYLKWIPRWTFSKASFRHLFSFGSKILCSGLINTIYQNIYTLVIGKVFSPKEVGYYNRGNQFAMLPSQTLLSVFMKVAYPVMAEVQDDTDLLRKAYRKFLRMPIFILWPILFGLIVLARPLILLLLGEKWLPCVPLLQVLCIGSFFNPLTHINLNILYVKGRTDLVLKLELIKKPIAFAILFGMIPLGLWWLCLGRAVYEFIAYCFNCYYTRKFIHFGFWNQMAYNVPVLIKSGIMGSLCCACTLVFVNPWLQLFVGTAVGIVSYFLMALITKDETMEDIKSVIFKR